MATIWPSLRSSARYTSPMPPRPTIATTRYRSAMIWPAANLPPPMGSELVSGFRGELGRGLGGGGKDEVAFRAEGDVEERVSPSRLISSPSRVVEVLRRGGFPHQEQNFASGETCWPQEEQNIGEPDSSTARQ